MKNGVAEDVILPLYLGYIAASLANHHRELRLIVGLLAGAGQKDGLPVANERMRILGKHSGKLGRLHLRFHGVVAVIEADAENFGRTLQGRLQGDGRQRREQIRTRLIQLKIYPGPPLRACGDEGERVRISKRTEREDVAVLEECRANGCITTVGDQAHPSIVHRLAKEWVKISKPGLRSPPHPNKAGNAKGAPGLAFETWDPPSKGQRYTFHFILAKSCLLQESTQNRAHIATAENCICLQWVVVSVQAGGLMEKPNEGRKRVVIENVQPQVNCGLFPIKRIVD